MTSLNLSCPGATPSSSLFRRPSFSAKPSQLLSHPNRRHGLEVRCAGGDERKVDRRNMLLGLGGLYGASNLISVPDASAAPIQNPDIEKCHRPINSNVSPDTKLNIYCCPPPSDTIIDYKLPPVAKMKHRRAAQKVDDDYIAKYNQAIQCMKALDKKDPLSFHQQANIHCAYCNDAYHQPGEGSTVLEIHNCWLFFPFHRWYLYFYERILGSLIGDPEFALPFWNWDNPPGMSIPNMFLEPGSALYDLKRDQTHLPPMVVDLSYTGLTDPATTTASNLAVMHKEMIGSNSSVFNVMGYPYRQGDDTSASNAGTVERGSHTSVHRWVGDPTQDSQEDLGNFYSAGRDPLFFCHHANVDRLWWLWENYLPSQKLPNKGISDPDFLNASFTFYDENRQLVRVTVEDCLDNRKMGFDYEIVGLPWLDYKAAPQSAGARAKWVGRDSPKAETVFPLTLDRVVRVVVPKSKKGKSDEVLVIENITVDLNKFVKFDVFVNDEDEDVGNVDKASYAGTYGQVPRKTERKTATTSLRLDLAEVYEGMDLADDDTIVVTLVPRHEGDGLTIGGIKVIETPAT